MRMKLAAMAAVMMIAVLAEGAPSKAAQEWRNGPIRWIMTGEEQKAWKSVATDADAAAFIDLFWARRDPTNGTSRNEAHERFQQRVQYADTNFDEGRRRGAMSERGQIFVILGPSVANESNNMAISGPSGMSDASSRASDRQVWAYSREFATAVGVPKLEVAFVQTPGTKQYVRDIRFGQFTNALPKILANQIVNNLTAVPEWAAPIGSEVLKVAATPRVAAKASGKIGRVLLLGDLGTLDLDAATDPFTTLQPVNEFAVDGELAYLIEYCGNNGALQVDLKVRDLTSSSELEPAPVKAVAGCGAVPGMMSLAGLKPGSYELEIATTEANGGKLASKTKFQIK
ncbi:MAG TPA: GWxTD domain-containing protein [Thermoanaerobaculia bacterium]|nr:GWxTD domain-containing protein [Thermoanaerobaculia bacterium]